VDAILDAVTENTKCSFVLSYNPLEIPFRWKCRKLIAEF
jgi:hypothetical protein